MSLPNPCGWPVLRRTLLTRALGLAGGLTNVASCSGTDARVIEVTNPIDGGLQRCTWLPARAMPRVLVVSPPTWSGSYVQADNLLPLCEAAGFAYLRPNLRAPNRSPQACLGPLVLSDLAAAVRAAETEGGLFTRRFLVGESGGAYVALGAWWDAGVRFDAVLAWNPISDLQTWYAFLQERHVALAGDVLACTASGAVLDVAQARARSPLHRVRPGQLPRMPLELFAGWHDGHAGTVPIEQSLRFFDAVTRAELGADCGLAAAQIAQLQQRMAPGPTTAEQIGGRAVIFRRSCSAVSLTIFDGAHEHLYDHSMLRLRSLAASSG